jgi:hypothetical protein
MSYSVSFCGWEQTSFGAKRQGILRWPKLEGEPLGFVSSLFCTPFLGIGGLSIFQLRGAGLGISLRSS